MCPEEILFYSNLGNFRYLSPSCKMSLAKLIIVDDATTADDDREICGRKWSGPNLKYRSPC
jgi:hypothetical protein